MSTRSRLDKDIASGSATHAEQQPLTLFIPEDDKRRRSSKGIVVTMAEKLYHSLSSTKLANKLRKIGLQIDTCFCSGINLDMYL